MAVGSGCAGTPAALPHREFRPRAAAAAEAARILPAGPARKGEKDMVLFSLECSAAAASAALYRDGKLLGEEFLNVPQTHSVTLLPMAQSLLEHTGVSPEQVDYYAVSRGPGSFTGLRIGIAAVKGLAFPDRTPCIGVSTPEAIAYGLLGFEGTVVPMMDARCGQVYTALFRGQAGTLTRLTEDEALPLTELKKKLQDCPAPLWLCGDGAHLGLAAWGEELPVKLAPAHLCYQRAAAVGLAAMNHLGEAVSPEALVPCYLRPANAMTLEQRQHKAE